MAIVTIRPRPPGKAHITESQAGHRLTRPELDAFFAQKQALPSRGLRGDPRGPGRAAGMFGGLSSRRDISEELSRHSDSLAPESGVRLRTSAG